MGFGVSAPPGPNAMLMVNRTLRKGHLSGFMTGLGVATADTIFAIIAGLSMSFIITFVNREAFYIKLVVGVLVALIGVKLLFTNPVWELRRKARAASKGTITQDFLSVFGMALVNPFSIFIFLALFPGMDISFIGSEPYIPLIVIVGVFAGASAWWFLFSYTVDRFSRSLSLRSIVKISRATGLIIIAIGITVLLTLFVSVRL